MDKRFKLKTCIKCGKEKPSSEFYLNRVHKKRASSCKECNKKQCTEYQRNSGYRETIKYVAYQRAHQLFHKSKSKQICCMEKLELRDHIIKLWERDPYCYYLREPLSLTGYHDGDPLAMTIDRIRPELGYMPGNIVLCCSIFNRMKQNMSLVELVDWCKKIIKALK